ncbi:MAG TPA: cyclase family protein [Terriglobales bacterium]|nr:cyclase family protein [Terriglobales bacterium]
MVKSTMNLRTFLIAGALAVTLFLFAQRKAEIPAAPGFSAVIDLTQPLSEKFPNWEGTEKSPFEARPLGRMERDGYFTRTISLPEHFATHVDAPAHFAAGRWTVDQIPPERLVAPLVLLDVRHHVRGNADYQITIEDVAHWEQANGQIPAGAIVVAYTAWAARAASMKDYRNPDAAGVMHFPGFLPETARFLVESRNVVALGIDTMSVDYGASTNWPVHKYTAARSVYHIENLGDLSRVPEVGALIVVAPAKLAGGSGGPARVLALVK